MRKTALIGTLLVLLHLAVNIVHGLAHEHLRIGLAPWQLLFVALVIIVGPVVAMILLWTPARRTGAWLLLLSMAGSLLFGAFFHFVAAGADNVAQLPHGLWGTQFKVSAALLAVVDVLGGWAGIWALVAIERSSGNGLPRLLDEGY